MSDFDFAIKGPLPWKSLPMDSRQAQSVMTFKKRLKTYLFRGDIPIQKIILFQRLETQTLNWLVTKSKRRYWNKLNNNNNNKNTLTHDRRKMSTFGQCIFVAGQASRTLKQRYALGVYVKLCAHVLDIQTMWALIGRWMEMAKERWTSARLTLPTRMAHARFIFTVLHFFQPHI